MDLSTLQADVTNFTQEKLDKGNLVSVMLGMEMLDLFDVDFDFPTGVM